LIVCLFVCLFVCFFLSWFVCLCVCLFVCLLCACLFFVCFVELREIDAVMGVLMLRGCLFSSLFVCLVGWLVVVGLFVCDATGGTIARLEAQGSLHAEHAEPPIRHQYTMCPCIVAMSLTDFLRRQLCAMYASITRNVRDTFAIQCHCMAFAFARAFALAWPSPVPSHSAQMLRSAIAWRLHSLAHSLSHVC
jgi:hypothetical protein